MSNSSHKIFVYRPLATCFTLFATLVIAWYCMVALKYYGPQWYAEIWLRGVLLVPFIFVFVWLNERWAGTELEIRMHARGMDIRPVRILRNNRYLEQSFSWAQILWWRYDTLSAFNDKFSIQLTNGTPIRWYMNERLHKNPDFADFYTLYLHYIEAFNQRDRAMPIIKSNNSGFRTLWNMFLAVFSLVFVCVAGMNFFEKNDLFYREWKLFTGMFLVSGLGLFYGVRQIIRDFYE